MNTRHWTEYAIEATLLGCFMISAAGFATLLFHPASVIVKELPDPDLRRALMGLAMGATALCIFYSPWGKRSGAHINPATTLTFFRLGRVARHDAVAYAIAQFTGATLGMLLSLLLLGRRLGDPAVYYVATMPGPAGALVAFCAEALLASLLMYVVLETASRPQLSRFTGLIAASLVALYIFAEAPLSGMSLNPARTFGSALAARDFGALWVYFTAPPLGMLVAAQLFLTRRPGRPVPCAKYRHDAAYPCIFCAWRGERP